MTTKKGQTDTIKEQTDSMKDANITQKQLAYMQKWIVVLTVLFVLVGIATLWNKTGRYAMSMGSGGMHILDTKTSQLWVRTTSSSTYLGTNENPMLERTPISETSENDK